MFCWIVLFVEIFIIINIIIIIIIIIVINLLGRPGGKSMTKHWLSFVTSIGFTPYTPSIFFNLNSIEFVVFIV